MLRLTFFTAILLINITCIYGQITLVKQPVEGYKGDGEVIAYSNNRILLILSKDGNWPRQIIWKVRTAKGPNCFVTFNSSGWNYAPSRDTCGLDWAFMKSQIIESHLFVSNIGTSSQTNSYLTLNESFRQIALQRSDSINLLSSFIEDKSNDAKNRIDINNLSPNTDAIKSPLIKALPNPVERSEKPSQGTISPEESMNQSILSDKNLPYELDSSNVLNTLNYKIFKEPKSNGKDTVLSFGLIQYDDKDFQPDIKPNYTNLLNSISSDKKEKRKSREFTLQNFENTETKIRNTDGVSTKIISSKTTLDTIVTPGTLKQIPNDLKNEKSTPKTYDRIPIELDLPNAPFISVASFRTLSYTKSVLHLFECPGDCKIVRSSKEDYYRIGFYPLEINIFAELMNIRKIYPDAWLVK